jgi:hypothetical protein
MGVCKQWKQIVLSEEFYKKLYVRVVPHAFGKEDYLKHLGGDSGIEPKIPLHYLARFRKGFTTLTLVPKEVRFTQEDGKVVIQVCSMRNMGEWAQNARNSHKISYHEDSYPELLLGDEHVQEDHWSFIDMALTEIQVDSTGQEERARARGGRVAPLPDLVLSLFLTFVKTGVRHLPHGADLGRKRARVPETNASGRKIIVGFAHGGIRLCFSNNTASEHLGVVVAY